MRTSSGAENSQERARDNKMQEGKEVLNKERKRSCELRVKFLLKTDSGCPRDAEVTLFALATELTNGC